MLAPAATTVTGSTIAAYGSKTQFPAAPSLNKTCSGLLLLTLLVTIIRFLPLLAEYVVLLPLISCFTCLQNIVPHELWRQAGSWLTPPFLFLIFNFVLAAILIPSGLFRLQKTDVADVLNAKQQVQRGDNVYPCTEVSQKTWPTPRSCVLLRSGNETASSKISSSSSKQCSESVVDKSDFQEADCFGVELLDSASNDISSSVNKQCPESLVDKLDFQETADSFGVEPTDSNIIIRSRGAETSQIEEKSASSLGIGHENVLCYEVDDLHQRIEAFIANARKQMRLPEPYVVKFYDSQASQNEYEDW